MSTWSTWSRNWIQLLQAATCKSRLVFLSCTPPTGTRMTGTKNHFMSEVCQIESQESSQHKLQAVHCLFIDTLLGCTRAVRNEASISVIRNAVVIPIAHKNSLQWYIFDCSSVLPYLWLIASIQPMQTGGSTLWAHMAALQSMACQRGKPEEPRDLWNSEVSAANRNKTQAMTGNYHTWIQVNSSAAAISLNVSYDIFNSSKMRSIGVFSTSLWPLCWKLVVHRIVHRATVKWLGEKRCDQHPAGYYEARRTLFQLQTKVNSQHGQHSQPLQQVDSASNVRDLPTFSISLRPGQCFFIVPCNIQLCLSLRNLVDLYTNSIHTRKNSHRTGKCPPWKRMYIFLLENQHFQLPTVDSTKLSMAELRWAIEAHSVDCLGHHLLIAISQEVAIKAVISNSYRITTVTNEFDPELLTVRGWKALSPNTEAPKLVSGYKLCSSSLQIGIFPHGLKAPSGSCPLPLCTFRRRFGVRWEHRQFRSKKCFDWYSVKVSLECSTIYVESVEPL